MDLMMMMTSEKRTVISIETRSVVRATTNDTYEARAINSKPM